MNRKQLSELHQRIIELEKVGLYKESDVLHDIFIKNAAKKKSKKKKNVPNNPSLWAECQAWAKRTYEIHPSAYSNAGAVRRYKSKGGTWRKASTHNVKLAQNNEIIRPEVNDLMIDILNEITSGKTNNSVDRYQSSKYLYTEDEQKAIENQISKAKDLKSKGISFSDVSTPAKNKIKLRKSNEPYEPLEYLKKNMPEIKNVPEKTTNPDKSSQESIWSDYKTKSYKEIITLAKYLLERKMKTDALNLIDYVVSNHLTLTNAQKVALKRQFNKISEIYGTDKIDANSYKAANDFMYATLTKNRINPRDLTMGSSQYNIVSSSINQLSNLKVKEYAERLLQNYITINEMGAE